MLQSKFIAELEHYLHQPLHSTQPPIVNITIYN